MSFGSMFFALVVWHVLADYPLQGDFLAKAKNRTAPVPGVPWWQALGAHSLIHAAGVACITHSAWLALVEFCAHAWIDDMKCRGRITFNVDQAMHIYCKALWALIACALQAAQAVAS